MVSFHYQGKTTVNETFTRPCFNTEPVPIPIQQHRRYEQSNCLHQSRAYSLDFYCTTQRSLPYPNTKSVHPAVADASHTCIYRTGVSMLPSIPLMVYSALHDILLRNERYQHACLCNISSMPTSSMQLPSRCTSVWRTSQVDLLPGQEPRVTPCTHVYLNMAMIHQVDLLEFDMMPEESRCTRNCALALFYYQAVINTMCLFRAIFDRLKLQERFRYFTSRNVWSGCRCDWTDLKRAK